jgi:hypothetical protein
VVLWCLRQPVKSRLAGSPGTPHRFLETVAYPFGVSDDETPGLAVRFKRTVLPVIRTLAGHMLVAWCPSELVLLTLNSLGPGQRGLSFSDAPTETLLSMLFFAPCVETYMMHFIFVALRKGSRNEILVNAASAALWGVLHFHTASWGLHAIWSFGVMGRCYLRQEKTSVQRAIVITAGVHVGINMLSFITWKLLNV